MIRLSTLGLMLFLSIANTIAQSDYKEGFIINNNNDTIYGLIDYKGNKSNSIKCNFKKDLVSENQLFTADELLGYRYKDSKYYISRSVKIGDESRQLFLEYLIDGVVDVFYYRDELGEHYLIETGEDRLYELKNEKEEIVFNQSSYTRETKEYIGILKITFQDSPTILKKVDNTKLNHKSLINITQDYHNEICSDEECIVYEKKLPLVKGTYGLLLGLNGLFISQINEISDELYYLKNSHFGFNVYPSIGLYFNINLPSINERLHFQYEGVFSRLSLTTSTYYFESLYNMEHFNDIALTQSAINSVFLVKYEFPGGSISPTFHLGGFFKYFINTDYNRTLTTKFNWSDSIYETAHTSDNIFNNNDLGLDLGFGFKCKYLNNKELFLDIRYQRGFGLLKNLNTNNFSLNIGFQIGK